MAIPIEQETVSSVFRHLVDESKKTISKIHEDTKISEMTLYSLYNRENKKADLRMLKTLADYFGVELEIFCGMRGYKPTRRLSSEEEMLVQQFSTLSDDAKLQVMGLIMRLKSDPANVVRLM